MLDILFGSLAVCCWIAAGLKLYHVRQGGEPAVVALASSLAALGVAVVLLMQPLIHQVDALTSIPTSAKLFGHGTVLIAAYAAQSVWILVLTPSAEVARPRMLRRAALLAATLAALGSLVLLLPPGQGPMRAASGAPEPNASGTAYVLLYTGYLGVATIDIARMSFRYARLADRMFLRAGQYLIGIGASLGFAYSLSKSSLAICQLFGIDDEGPARNLLAILILASVLLIALGSTLPSWGPRFGPDRATRWLVRWISYRALTPLWSALVDAFDMVVLLPHSSILRARAAGFSLEFLLYRRMTEISDALLLLRPYLDPGVADRARGEARSRGLSEEEVDAVVQAASIAAALEARAGGIQFGAAGDASPAPYADPDSKSWWLQRVTQAYRTSPVVRETRAWARQRSGAATASTRLLKTSGSGPPEISGCRPAPGGGQAGQAPV
jgi:hypothetical protein